MILVTENSEMNRQLWTLFESLYQEYFLEDSTVFEFLSRIAFVLMKMVKLEDLEMEIDQLHLEVCQSF